MSAEENKALVQRFYDEVLNQRNLAALEQIVAPDAVNRSVPAGLPQGPSQFLSLHFEALPDITVTVEDLLADGDKVVARVTIRGTQQGALRGVSATSKPITVMGINIFRIASGQIVEHWGLADRLSALHQLLGAIETVRLKRQEEYREKSHPQLKRFTQQELNDEVCPTYKNWLIGRSNRLPSRSMLMNIADYLECRLSERNDVLLAAQYLPEQPELEGAELQRALEHAQQIMETLPYPAMVVTHMFQIQAANELLLRLFELPPLDTIPQHQRSTIHFLFHPDFCRSSTFNAEARALWQKHALSGIQLFKQQNVLSQYDAWYQQSVQQWCEIPGFQKYWEMAREVTRQEIAPTKVVLARMATTGEVLPIRIRHMLVSVSGKISPAVSAFLPVDEAARAVYASFGSVISSYHTLTHS